MYRGGVQEEGKMKKLKVPVLVWNADVPKTMKQREFEICFDKAHYEFVPEFEFEADGRKTSIFGHMRGGRRRSRLWRRNSKSGGKRGCAGCMWRSEMIVDFELKDIYGVGGIITADIKDVSLRRMGDYKYAIIGGKEYEVTTKVFCKLYKMKASGKAREVYREEGETW